MTTSQHTHRPLALITGGARRVGRATTLALARSGCDVIITFDRSAADAERTLSDALALGADPRRSRTLHLPLGSPDAIESDARVLASTLEILDVLVHNASTYIPTPLRDLTAHAALAAFHVNALAPAILSAHLAPILARSGLAGGGAIVAMCDIHALGEHGLPRRNHLAYAMSKGALAEMVRSLARELAPRVRVNGVAPGVAAWPEDGAEADPALQAAYLERVPLARAGTPDECAQTVRWLALDATYITGQILRFDGGRSMM